MIMEIIKKYLTGITVSVMFAFGLAVVAAPPSLASADAKGQVCGAIGGCVDGGSEVARVITVVINILSTIGGIIAVIMIIIAGFKFMTAAGDANSAASARNTIIYAVVGLIVIAFAQIIVRFVLQSIE